MQCQIRRKSYTSSLFGASAGLDRFCCPLSVCLSVPPIPRGKAAPPSGEPITYILYRQCNIIVYIPHIAIDIYIYYTYTCYRHIRLFIHLCYYANYCSIMCYTIMLHKVLKHRGKTASVLSIKVRKDWFLRVKLKKWKNRGWQSCKNVVIWT